MQNYQHYGKEVLLSISADATCRGLRNAREGQIAVELSKGKYRLLVSCFTVVSSYL